MFVSVSELRLVKGISKALYDYLVELVIALPDSTAQLNVNTAKLPLLRSLGNAETNKSASGVADIILEGAQNEAFIKERDKQTMVFPIGATGVSTVDSNPSYVYKGVEADQFSTGGVATFSLSDDLNFTYGTSDTTLSETQERDLIIIPKQNINAASRTAEGNANVASSTNSTRLDVHFDNHAMLVLL